MPFVTAAGTRVHFTDTGGDGPAVILSHGFFLDHEMFARQASELGTEYRIIAVDARGHGLTEDAGEPFTYWDLANDVWAVVDALGIEKVVAGGMSQGGYTAMRMALQRPERVRGLILIATSAEPYTPEEQARYRGIMKAWMGMTPFEPMAEVTAKTMIGGSPEDQRPWIDKWCTGDRGRIRLAADCLIERESVAEAIGGLEQAVVLIRGEHDQAESHEDMARLAKQFGGAAEFHTIAGATHGVNITHAAEVNTLLRGYLSGLE
ncbi:alpha/beta hydrolase [Nocardia sp. NPDC052001]|uniref:alpha/beta fold hydrolase n=1 Tax=Nocardia sp. NPDC052001 TaxID=3154853 RepID=UPI003412E6DE